MLLKNIFTCGQKFLSYNGNSFVSLRCASRSEKLSYCLSDELPVCFNHIRELNKRNSQSLKVRNICFKNLLMI